MASKVTQPAYSNFRPVWKIVVLSFLTFGIYNMFWLIRNWWHIERDTRKTVSFLAYVGLFILIVNIFVVYMQFDDIQDVAKKERVRMTWGVGWMAFWLVALTSGALRTHLIQDWQTFLIGFLLLALSWLPMINVQETLNDIWGKTQGKLPKRQGIVVADLIWLAIGVIAWTNVITRIR